MSVGEILLRRLPHAADLPPPAYATAGAAGFDLRAAIDGEITLAPGARVLAPTGFCFAMPAAGKSRSVPGRDWRRSMG